MVLRLALAAVICARAPCPTMLMATTAIRMPMIASTSMSSSSEKARRRRGLVVVWCASIGLPPGPVALFLLFFGHFPAGSCWPARGLCSIFGGLGTAVRLMHVLGRGLDQRDHNRQDEGSDH